MYCKCGALSPIWDCLIYYMDRKAQGGDCLLLFTGGGEVNQRCMCHVHCVASNHNGLLQFSEARKPKIPTGFWKLLKTRHFNTGKQTSKCNTKVRFMLCRKCFQNFFQFYERKDFKDEDKQVGLANVQYVWLTSPSLVESSTHLLPCTFLKESFKTVPHSVDETVPNGAVLHCSEPVISHSSFNSIDIKFTK